MPNSQIIEERLREARQAAADTQSQLQHQLLLSDGAENEETARLRAEVAMHQTRAKDLGPVLEAAYEADRKAETEARAAKCLEAVEKAGRIAPRYISTAAGVDAALFSLTIARSEFMQLEAEMRETAREVVELSNADRSRMGETLSHVSLPSLDEEMQRHVDAMFAGDKARDSIESQVRKRAEANAHRLAEIAQRPPAGPVEVTAIYQPPPELNSHTALLASSNK